MAASKGYSGARYHAQQTEKLKISIELHSFQNG
jgi:hypothetical protein